MGQYLLIPFLGDEHPFTSYFDVHQGYKVLTHCQLKKMLDRQEMLEICRCGELHVLKKAPGI